MSIKLLGKYLLIFLLFTLIYLSLFHLPVFSGQKVIFYRGIYLLVLATIVTAVLMVAIRKRIGLGWETLIAAIVMSSCIHLAVFIVFPVTFDRSVTIFLLNTLDSYPANQICRGYTEGQLQDELINGYIKAKGALAKRLNEQEIINFVADNNRCVSLTKKGTAFIRSSKIIDKIYGIDH